MGLYHERGDFATNFPHILRKMKADYAEFQNDSENGKRFTPIRWKKSRNVAKRSAKRSSATNKMHFLERQIFLIPIENPNSKKTLILKIEKDFSVAHESYFVKTPIGDIYIDYKHSTLSWCASWFGVRSAHADNPYGALAKLLAQEWGQNIFTGEKASIYSLFKAIHFDTGQKLPNLRNRTYKFPEKIAGFRMIWEKSEKMPVQPTWTPPQAAPKKLRVVFGDGMQSEKSLL